MEKPVLLLSGESRLIIDAVCYSLASAFIVVHFYGRVRFFGRPFPFLSDYFLVASWVVGVAQQVVQDYFLYTLGFWDSRLLYSLSDNNPYYLDVIPDASRVVLGFKVLYATETLYLVAIYLAKMVYLLSYTRLFTTGKKLWVTLISTIAIVTLGYIALVGMQLFYCQPIRGNWTVDVKTRCTSVSMPPVYFMTAILHLTSDIVIFALPFFALVKIKAETVRSGGKINIWAVRGMFSLGFLCIIIPIGRLSVSAADIFIMQGTVYAAILTAELTLPLIVTCLPMVRRLWIAHLERDVGTILEVEAGYNKTVTLATMNTFLTLDTSKTKMSQVPEVEERYNHQEQPMRYISRTY